VLEDYRLLDDYEKNITRAAQELTFASASILAPLTDDVLIWQQILCRRVRQPASGDQWARAGCVRARAPHIQRD
jgi:hypothetical protein